MKNLFNILVSITLSLILLISVGSSLVTLQQEQQANAQNTAEESQTSAATITPSTEGNKTIF
jgi:hypothetical protein